MKKEFGIMQGRLLPKFHNKYQAHPIAEWEEEFELAAKLGIKNIEFIFDLYLYFHNPLVKDLEKIISIQKNSGVLVKSICADFFMEAPIHRANKKELEIFHDLISRLISNLSLLGGTDIVIPFVDNSKIENDLDKKKIIHFLNSFKNLCEAKKVNLCLETDLNPSEFKEFIKAFKNSFITINYDSGNSASLGYSIKEELNNYGDLITNIHIKDRKLNGESVILGTGNADLPYLKNFIEQKDFDGIITFQAYRDNEGIEIFKKQFQYFLNL